MKNRLSSFIKVVTGSESCGICAIAVTIIAVVVVWQVFAALFVQVQDLAGLQDFAALGK
jgi:hypothetical protein